MLHNIKWAVSFLANQTYGSSILVLISFMKFVLMNLKFNWNDLKCTLEYKLIENYLSHDIS